MKSRTWKWMTALSLFAALAMPVGMAAQDSSTPKHHRHHTYRLIDMGTLGGAQSYVNDQANGAPSLNNRGDLVGAAETPIPLNQYSNSFTCFPGPNVNHGFLYKRGMVADLGALSPSNSSCSNAQAVSNSGIAAGNSENGVVDPIIGVNEIRAVVWNGHTMDLGGLGGNVSGATLINNPGQVVGFATNGVSDPYSFYYSLVAGSPDGTQTRAFLWQNGVMRDLGTLGGPDALAALVNDGGQVAGQSYTSSFPNPTTGIPTFNPFLWKNGRMRDLGNLGGTIGFAEAMNNRGQVVGPSNLAGDLTSHPYLWEGIRIVDLGTLGGDNGEALGIDNQGDVVGKADLPDQTHDAFLWTHGVMTDLGRFPNYPCSRANQINEQRQIVGNVSDCENALRAVLWENGQPGVDLNALVPPNSPLLLTTAVTINDRGEIAGAGVPAGCQPQDADSCGHAFLLIPQGDCDSSCEQGITDSQQKAASTHVSAKAGAPMTPAERLRTIMRERMGLHGQSRMPRG